jgi:hypothetical protein
MTGELDLLWLLVQPGCDYLYPLRDPDPSSPARQSMSELCLVYEAGSNRGWWEAANA